MVDSIRLLRSIGYIDEDLQFTVGEEITSSDLHQLSETNKISSLYTTRLKEAGNIEGLESEYESTTTYLKRFKQTGRKVIDTLQEEGIQFWIVKTPFEFPADFGDLDVLVENSSLDSAIEVMEKSGFEEFSSDPMGAQFQDPETKRLVDIQRDFALRHVVYLPGNVVRNNTSQTTLFDRQVAVPSPPAQICLLAIHSVTEQLFLLRDFYHLLYLFQQMKDESHDILEEIVKRRGLTSTMETVLPIVKGLSQNAFQRVPSSLQKACREWENDSELKRLQKSGWETPHRYTGRSFLGSVRSKFNDPVFRRSLLMETKELKNPVQVTKNIKHLIERQRKETY